MSLQPVHLTEAEAQILAGEWQTILHLQNWDILVRVVRGNGLDLAADTQGRCDWTIERREATIRLMDPVDWDAAISRPQDMETTLVHELLHLHFAPFDSFKAGTPEDIASEQAIQAISKALVALKRAAKV